MSSRPISQGVSLLLIVTVVAITFGAVLFAAPVAAVPVVAGPPPGAQFFYSEPDSHEVIVRFAPRAEFDMAARGVAHLRAGAVRERVLRGMPGYELVTVPDGSSVDEILGRYLNDPTVLYAEPNYPVSIDAVPNDSRFGEQWGLHNTGQSGGTQGADIKAEHAWTVTTGGEDVIVAVIDTGVEYRHPDLADNVWSGIGWNFAEGNDDPMDYHGHGTHVAGTIAAVGDDGYGVAGVAWDARIMALKALGDDGRGWTADIAEAVTYASNHGADVINMSLGGGSYSQVFYDAIAASDALVVVAAGNSGANTDSSPSYPASYDLDNIVAVAATDRTDTIASWSNYGATTVDLGAPGVSILSTVPGHTYEATTVFSDPMNTLGAWNTGSYRYNPWTHSSTHYASPSHSAAHAPPGGYVANEQSWIDMRDYVSLSGADSMAVRFNARLDLVSEDDGLLVAALPEGGHWVGLGWVDGSTGGAFRSYRFENSTLAGRNVLLAFVFFSGAQGGGAGVWVDDVEIDALVLDGSADYSDAHAYMSGTSMAAPHVAGAAVLLKAYSPDLDHAGLKAAILDTVEPLSSLDGKTVTGGRLDAAAALASAEPPNSVPVAESVSYLAEAGVDLAVIAPGVLANDTDADGDTLTAELDIDVAAGRLSLAADGSFMYSPLAGFTGDDTFTYRAYDGIEYSEPATVTIEVVDTTAPVSTATLDPNAPDGLAGWYMTAPSVSIEATDTGSGVDYIEWRIAADGELQHEDGAAATVTGMADGEHTLSYRAADVAGNVEETRTVELKVDTTPPVTTSDAADTYEKTATITLDATDATSGVAETFYRLGDGDAVVYEGPITVEVLGSHTLTFWSVDVAGNTEAEQTATIDVVDITAPSSTATVAPAAPDGLVGWYVSAPAVSIEATDTESGVDYIEWRLAEEPWQREYAENATVANIAEGEHTLSYRAADLAGNVEETRTVTFAVDTEVPVTTSDAVEEYVASAGVSLTANDDTSGVLATYFTIDGGAETTYTAPIEVAEVGTYTLAFWSVDVAGNVETEQTVTFNVAAGSLPSIIKGADRYLTAVAGSKAAFDDGAPAVVIATGENFADALGGAGLAGALNGPLLLTQKDVLLSEVATEISRLGATKVYILGGAGAISADVGRALDRLSGVTSVTRIAGANRYETASKVAAETIKVLNASGGYGGDAFIATGANFPDALGASSIAAVEGMPVFLADPARSTVNLPASVERVWITGGTAVVSTGVENSLKSTLGTASVKRFAGRDRFDTAARVAAFGVSRGMTWNGAGIITGMNFPDALAAGPVLGSRDSVMLLTDTDSVPGYTRNALVANRAKIDAVTFFGGDAVVPPSVRMTVNNLIK